MRSKKYNCINVKLENAPPNNINIIKLYARMISSFFLGSEEGSPNINCITNLRATLSHRQKSHKLHPTHMNELFHSQKTMSVKYTTDNHNNNDK